MKKLLVSAAFLAVAAIPATSLAVTATPVQGDVTVNGAVAARCQFTGGGTATITIAELADTTTGVLDATTVNGKTATLNGWCNGTTSTMAVEAQSLVNAGSAPTGFTNTVTYSASATAHPASGNVVATDTSTVGGAGTAVGVGVFTSNIDIALSAAGSNGSKLLAGAYTGHVLVTLTPGL